MIIFYIHIFKTGGQAVREILANYHGDRFSRAHQDQVCAGNINDGDIIAGHFVYGAYTGSVPHVYTTMLRHPVDRRISRWYSRQNVEYPTARSLRDWYINDGYDRNISVRAIAGDAVHNKFDEARANPVNKDDFLVAKSHLDSMPFFGIYQYFDYSLDRMFETFGWGNKRTESHDNASPFRPHHDYLLDPYLVEVVREYESYDYELYEYAVEKFRGKYNI